MYLLHRFLACNRRAFQSAENICFRNHLFFENVSKIWKFYKFFPIGCYRKKSRLGPDEDILGGTGGYASAPLTLVATVAKAECLDDLRLFALGALANLTTPIAVVADRLAGFVARLHPFDLSAF